MRFPRWYARFNRAVTNKVVRLWAGRLPGMGVLRHSGRRSGTTYRTPFVVFPLENATGVVVQVGYGPKTDWLKNVAASGGAQLEYRGQLLDLDVPTVETREEARTLVSRRWRALYRVVPFPEAAVFRRQV